jgi:hypothetical protein
MKKLNTFEMEKTQGGWIFPLVVLFCLIYVAVKYGIDYEA